MNNLLQEKFNLYLCHIFWTSTTRPSLKAQISKVEYSFSLDFYIFFISNPNAGETGLLKKSHIDFLNTATPTGNPHPAECDISEDGHPGPNLGGGWWEVRTSSQRVIDRKPNRLTRHPFLITMTCSGQKKEELGKFEWKTQLAQTETPFSSQ